MQPKRQFSSGSFTHKASAPKSLSSSVCRALQLRKASGPTEPQQLGLTSSTTQVRPCNPRDSSAQAVFPIRPQRPRASVAQFAELFSSERPQRPRSSSAQFVELFSSRRPQRPQELFNSVCRALQLRKVLAPTEPQQLGLMSSTAQLRPCSPRDSSAQAVLPIRPQRPRSSVAQFAELFSSGRPQQLCLTSSTAQLRPCSPRDSSAQAVLPIRP